jgi:predicted nucleotidyltransferase
MEQTMSDTTLLALFDEIDPAADAIEKLREMGVTDDKINIISGVPITHQMLGRPHPHTNVATFLGVFLDSYFPNYRPLEYVAEVSDGKIGVFFKCAQDEQKKFMDALGKMGAESIKPVEAQQL